MKLFVFLNEHSPHLITISLLLSSPTPSYLHCIMPRSSLASTELVCWPLLHTTLSQKFWFNTMQVSKGDRRFMDLCCYIVSPHLCNKKNRKSKMGWYVRKEGPWCQRKKIIFRAIKPLRVKDCLLTVLLELFNMYKYVLIATSSWRTTLAGPV